MTRIRLKAATFGMSPSMHLHDMLAAVFRIADQVGFGIKEIIGL